MNHESEERNIEIIVNWFGCQHQKGYSFSTPTSRKKENIRGKQKEREQKGQEQEQLVSLEFEEKSCVHTDYTSVFL